LESCTFPVENDEWRRWHNIESYKRDGIALFELDEHQKELAFHILKTSMSEKGVSKARNIMLMEAYLKEISTQVGNGNNMPLELLGADKYWFTFMGTPSDTEPWGWQIDGHHLVINYFILGDQVVMTPTFMGSELTHIENGPFKGVGTFVEEGKKGLALLHALNKDQQDHADIKMNELKHHLPETWFCWIGGSGENDVFYYRIHSPVLLIEYDHHSPVFVVKPGESSNKPVNWHVHTVVWTPNGNDYGKDLLRQHLDNHHDHEH
jgi:hypothetical protein